jgi:hypothetical protein
VRNVPPKRRAASPTPTISNGQATNSCPWIDSDQKCWTTLLPLFCAK